MADSPQAGDPAPEFRLPSTHGEISLTDLRLGASSVVVVFYVEDGTPLCQTELSIFRDAAEVLDEAEARVVGISAGSVPSHERFAARLGGMPFPLASDASLEVARAYGVVDDGDERRSRRAVFVVGRDGNVTLALPLFQPNNVGQVEQIFASLPGQRG